MPIKKGDYMALISAQAADTVSVEGLQTIHEKEFELMNEIDAMANEIGKGFDDWPRLEAKLNEYTNHVRAHFDEEEELMEEYDYPFVDMHTMAHDLFKADMNYAETRWKRFGEIERIIDFVRKSPEWLTNHITTNDVALGEYLAPRMK
jgi:hemerythrin-like metal-binding protein